MPFSEFSMQCEFTVGKPIAREAGRAAGWAWSERGEQAHRFPSPSSGVARDPQRAEVLSLLAHLCPAIATASGRYPSHSHMSNSAEPSVGFHIPDSFGWEKEKREETEEGSGGRGLFVFWGTCQYSWMPDNRGAIFLSFSQLKITCFKIFRILATHMLHRDVMLVVYKMRHLN